MTIFLPAGQEELASDMDSGFAAKVTPESTTAASMTSGAAGEVISESEAAVGAGAYTPRWLRNSSRSGWN
jgi:hypothetical protein